MLDVVFSGEHHVMPLYAVGLSSMVGFGSIKIKYIQYIQYMRVRQGHVRTRLRLKPLWKQQFDFIWFCFHMFSLYGRQLDCTNWKVLSSLITLMGQFMFGSCVTYFHSRYEYVVIC